MAVDLVALAYRMLHIGFGIAWIGGVAFSVGVLRFVMPRLGDATRKEVLRFLIPAVTRYIPLSAAMTILFGTLLYLHLGAYNVNILFNTAWGQTLLGALVLTVATFIYGLVAVIGTSGKILEHLQEEVCEHGLLVKALQVRFNFGQLVVFGLGLVIVGVMVYVVGALRLG